MVQDPAAYNPEFTAIIIFRVIQIGLRMSRLVNVVTGYCQPREITHSDCGTLQRAIKYR